MAKKVVFKLDIGGLTELKKSAEMKAVLEEMGSSVASSAGGDYDYRVHDADYTSIVNIYPATKEAARDNYENNTLLNALGASGLSMRK